ncbi:MAG: hypothetical protein ACTSQP_11160 [Promethearchaeota archaeon]
MEGLKVLARKFKLFEGDIELGFVTAGGGNSSKPVDYFWVPNKYWEIDKESDNEIVINQTLESQKLIREIKELDNIFPDQNIPELFDNIPDEISEDIKENLKKIPKKIWNVFKSSSREELRKLIKQITKSLSIPKKYLVKSLVRNLKSMEDQPPKFNNNFPYIFFLNYSEISKNPKEEYYIWGELLRKTLASWVCAPPRSASMFFPVKIRFNTMKTIAIRPPELLDSARVAGIIFVPKDSSAQTKERMDVLFAYLTSSIFLLDYIQKGRLYRERYDNYFQLIYTH